MKFKRFSQTLFGSAAGVLLLGSSLAPVAAASSAPQVALSPGLKLHPLLQAETQTNPASLVRVIVQTTKLDVKADALHIPGLALSDQYTVIPAFAATVPAAALPLLAANPSVRYVSPDGAVDVAPETGPVGRPGPRPKPPKWAPTPKQSLDASNLETTYPIDTGAAQAWTAPGDRAATGAGVTVAVIDSGVDSSHPDLSGRLFAVNVNPNSHTTADGYGHGTHVAGIIAGHDQREQYLGIAPNANLVSVKIADDNGAAYVSDVLRGLEWVQANRGAFKIRAVNLSISVSIPESYTTSPVDAAVEHLWDEGVTVVASAGNLGSADDAVWYAPGNDPLILTVGCLDENDDTSAADDSLCPISSRGRTEDGFAKPDLVAPGRKIVSALAAGNGRAGLSSEFPDRVTQDGRHIRLSGTSMSAPMVTGAVALLLDRKDGLTPSQIKQLLVNSTRQYAGQPDAAGALDIAAAVAASDHPPANKIVVPLPLGGGIVPGPDGATVLWDGARWTSLYWDGARWTSAYWDGARWTGAGLDGARWTGAGLDGARWTGAGLDGARWTGAYWDGARWTGAQWDGARWTSSGS